MAAKRVVVIGAASAVVAVAAFVLIAPAFLRPGADRLALVQTPRDYGVTFETVEFRPPDQPITLRAWWMPAAQPKAAIILVHGGGDDNRSLPYADGLKLAHDLVAHDYAVLAVDLRNYGESDASPEGVTFGDAESNDVIGAMNYLARRSPDLRYGAVGFSMGGETVLYAAARDRRLEAVVTTDTFAEVRPVAPSFLSASTGLPWLLIVPLLSSAEHLHGVPLARGRAIDVVGAIPPRPVLLIQNEADPIVPVEHCRRLAAAIAGSEVWITRLPQRTTHSAPHKDAGVDPSLPSAWGRSSVLDRGAQSGGGWGATSLGSSSEKRAPKASVFDHPRPALPTCEIANTSAGPGRGVLGGILALGKGRAGRRARRGPP